MRRHLILVVVLMFPSQKHPLHTTMTEVTRNGPVVTITLRGFVDDLTRAAVGHQLASPSAAAVDSVIARYVTRHLIVGEAGGRRSPLMWVSVRHQADVAWFTYTTTLHETGSFHIGNSVLCEIYDDQVNIVQVIQGTVRRSLLFSPGDHLKAVP